jgi:hypothetical protein
MPESLDQILALQFLVAWAGEGLSEPRRLNWWRTDLIDDIGGGDLLKRLLPKTYQWATLEALRQSAIRLDRQKRLNLAEPDKVRTLFFWGFTEDEQLENRFQIYKREGRSPAEVLPLSMELGSNFDQNILEQSIHLPGQEPKYKIVPGGREIQEPIPSSLELRVEKLVASLLPIAEEYPMPFYRLGEK